MRWAGNIACKGERRNGYRVVVEKTEGRLRHRLEDNIKMDLTDIGWNGIN
jgi:hypothetical protein